MSVKGSRLSRALSYFRECADLDELRVAFKLTEEIVHKRLAQVRGKAKRARKSAATNTGSHEHAETAAAN